MRGFDTIGSATLIAYDDGPVLTTDPWINDSAYFGSWGHDYAIPAEQLSAIKAAPRRPADAPPIKSAGGAAVGRPIMNLSIDCAGCRRPIQGTLIR